MTHAPSPFLNVDLDLRSAADLSPIASALGGAIFVLVSEPVEGRGYLLSFELVEGDWPPGNRSADTIVAGLCALVEGLAPPLRALWDGCTHRDFSIGLESWSCGGHGAPLFEVRLTPEVLARVARLGATVSATLYPLYDVPAPVRARYALARAKHRRRRHHARVTRR